MESIDIFLDKTMHCVLHLLSSFFSVTSVVKSIFTRECVPCTMKNPVIATKLGKVKGKVATDYLGGKCYSFRGIPYAKAPIGNLRFKAPQKRKSWAEEFDATKEGPSCPSSHIFFMRYTGKEDNCLNLNVYVKQLPNSNTPPIPVMVWIHGGCFTTGSNSSVMYNPKFLMTEDVIQVIINYRLGIFGFLCLEDENLGVTGNAGLKDQVMALEWVKENISSFGGDPNNVTIYGQSSGAASAHYLMLSPKTKGLFHQVILQSGSVFSPWARGQRGAEDIVKYLGIKEDNDKTILDVLQKMSARKLVAAQSKLPEFMLAGQHRHFGPIIEKPSEDAFLSEDPLKIIQSGNYYKVPMIVGATSNEGIFYDMFKKLRKMNLPFDCNMEIPFELNISQKTKSSELLAERINKFYNLDEGIHNEKHCELKSDNLFTHGIHRTVNYHLKTNSHPIYYYIFSFHGDLNYSKNFATVKSPERYFTCCYLSAFFSHTLLKNTFGKMARNMNFHEISGSCHADDLGYLFHSIISIHIKPDSREDKTIKRMVKLWTNFAKYGNPTPQHLEGENEILWRPVDHQHHHFLDIGDELIMKTNPFEARNKFWDEMYELSERI